MCQEFVEVFWVPDSSLWSAKYLLGFDWLFNHTFASGFNNHLRISSMILNSIDSMCLCSPLAFDASPFALVVFRWLFRAFDAIVDRTTKIYINPIVCIVNLVSWKIFCLLESKTIRTFSGVLPIRALEIPKLLTGKTLVVKDVSCPQ